MTTSIVRGEAIQVMRQLDAASVDAIVTDPPYGLGFMGKAWDDLPPGEEWARECLRVLKPGGHMLAFGGTRTWHRLAVAIEDAGFEIRDSIAWLYGSGFPKSLDVGKAIDKAARGVPQGGSDPTSPNHGKYRTTTTEGKRWDGDAGQGYGAGGSRFLADGREGGSATDRAVSGSADPVADRWQGWGTALKPAHEPIIVARKPLVGTVAQNVQAHGTGALNIDACRVGDDTSRADRYGGKVAHGGSEGYRLHNRTEPFVAVPGRWPANVVLDEDQAAALDAQSGNRKSGYMKPETDRKTRQGAAYGKFSARTATETYGDQGGASRFFYVAKAPKNERPVVGGIAHPTVKPLSLMRWLVRLVTPPGGTVLDPFAGSGTTLEAAILEGFSVIGIEREAEYLPLIKVRLERARAAR